VLNSAKFCKLYHFELQTCRFWPLQHTHTHTHTAFYPHGYNMLQNRFIRTKCFKRNLICWKETRKYQREICQRLYDIDTVNLRKTLSGHPHTWRRGSREYVQHSYSILCSLQSPECPWEGIR